MTIEEIVHGESKNVEFKVTLPKDSEKYIKSIIAFDNMFRVNFFEKFSR